MINKRSILLYVSMILYTFSIQASDRVALVIGNYNYLAATPLKNPQHDVKAISRTLSFMGYEVIPKENLGYQDLKTEINAFKNRRKGKVSLIYYSGHGVQIGGINYIVPVDYHHGKNTGLVKLDDFLSSVSNNADFGVAIFDACRNNPFGDTISSQYIKGLSRVNITPLKREKPSSTSTPNNTIIAFATKDGKKALDGYGYYSPYTEALLKYLPENRSDIFTIFGKVRDHVRKITNKYQDPYIYGSIGRIKLFLTDVPVLQFFDRRKIAVSKSEVTVSEYMQCVVAKSCNVPEWLKYKSEYHIFTGKSKAYKHLSGSEHPIVGINWHDAITYVKWLSGKTNKKFKLLTDREWLSIAGKNINIYQINCKGCNNTWGGVSTSPVGSFKEVNGLNDMFGNVWEWVCSTNYANNNCIKPMLRGGSWMSDPQSILQFKQLYPPSFARDVNIGFRIGINL